MKIISRLRAALLTEAPVDYDVTPEDPWGGHLGFQIFDKWNATKYIHHPGPRKGYTTTYDSQKGQFILWKNKTKQIITVLKGNMHPGRSYNVSSLRSIPNSPIKAHQFYRHLIKTGLIRDHYSDEVLSTGAQKVWGRLAKQKDIVVTHSDPEEVDEVPIRSYEDVKRFIDYKLSSTRFHARLRRPK